MRPSTAASSPLVAGFSSRNTLEARKILPIGAARVCGDIALDGKVLVETGDQIVHCYLTAFDV